MPMPTLIAKKYMTTKAARFFQEKKKRAAMAPTWKSPMAMVVIQLMRPCWCSRPMRRSCLIFWVTSAPAGTTWASFGGFFIGAASMVLRGVIFSLFLGVGGTVAAADLLLILTLTGVG